MSYIRFALMILTSTLVMFFLMYLNTYALEHVFFSETRTYMAIMMGAVMAAIMLAYMLGMYKNAMLNVAIFVGSVLVFAISLWLVRSQVTVSGTSYMRAMIPHHSIAITIRAYANWPMKSLRHSDGRSPKCVILWARSPLVGRCRRSTKIRLPSLEPLKMLCQTR